MLHKLSPAVGSRPKKKRIARGNSAGGGTTAGRGSKGQHSRSGNGRRLGFEGGQTPLLSRQPKLGGFRNPNRKEYEIITLGLLEEKLDAGTYDIPTLRDLKILRTNKPVKLLSRGTLSKKMNLTVNGASRSAQEAVKKAGGSLNVEAVGKKK